MVLFGKWYNLRYQDKYGNTKSIKIKAKNATHAENLFYKQQPYSLVMRIEQTDKYTN